MIDFFYESFELLLVELTFALFIVEKKRKKYPKKIIRGYRVNI